MKNHSVPFVENPGGRCAQAVAGMVIGALRPNSLTARDQIDYFTGYTEGQATWGTRTLLSAHELGMGVCWIEDMNLEMFCQDPPAVMQELFPDPAVRASQSESVDFLLEAQRVQNYLNRGLPFEQRPGTIQDVTSILDDRGMARLEVNGKPLAGQEGYGAHVILGIGYTDDYLIAHNPDGLYGSKPNQHIEWDLLEQAWDEYGGSRSVHGFFGNDNNYGR